MNASPLEILYKSLRDDREFVPSRVSAIDNAVVAIEQANASTFHVTFKDSESIVRTTAGQTSPTPSESRPTAEDSVNASTSVPPTAEQPNISPNTTGRVESEEAELKKAIRIGQINEMLPDIYAAQELANQGRSIDISQLGSN